MILFSGKHQKAISGFKNIISVKKSLNPAIGCCYFVDGCVCMLCLFLKRVLLHLLVVIFLAR